jgi:hypothetical protein
MSELIAVCALADFLAAIAGFPQDAVGSQTGHDGILDGPRQPL